MNCLDTEARAKVISCLIEGCSIRATVRMTGVPKNTVVKLLADIGCACAAYHNQTVRNLKVRRLQDDEIWCFVGAKAKNTRPEKKQEGWGDIWTWVGIDADTKLVVSYLVGGRDGGWATEFMQNLTMRMHMRRFTRLTNGFSKKVDNHRHSVALHYMFYNFCRIHQTLKVTPAMEAGITDHVWSLEEVCALLPKPTVSRSKVEKNLIAKALGEKVTG